MTTPAWRRFQRDQKHRIAGSLNPVALARLHFSTFTQDEQLATLRRLTAAGHSAEQLSRATGLPVDTVRSMLAEGGAP